MICFGCRNESPMTRNGLCRCCRGLAKQPQWQRLRRGSAALRWIRPEYTELRRARGLTPEQTVLRSEMIFRELRLVFTAETIVQWNLDNPYMFKHARRTMVSYILRRAVKFNKKPVQSARPDSTRKAIAA